MAENLGSYAVNIPKMFQSPGEALQAATSQEERFGEKIIEMSRQQRLLDQKQREQNFGNLLKATQFENYDTPDVELNKITERELNNIREEGKQLISRDPLEFDSWLSTRPKDFNSWYRMAKSDLGNVTAQRQEFNKDFPNVNLAKANNMVSKSFLDNYTEIDTTTGQRAIKPVHLITPQNDYYGQLKTPQALGEITEYTQPATDLFQKIKTENVGDKEYTNKRGQITTKKWSGLLTPFTKMDEDEKGNPIAVTKYESMNVVNPVTGKMEEMKLATPEMVQYVMQSSPGATAAMFKLWSDEKKAKGLTNLHPAVEDPLFKNFVYKYADKNLPHQIKTEEGTVTPKISVNVGAPVGTAGINDIYSEISDLTNKKAENKGYNSNGNIVTNATPVNELSATAQGIVLDYVKKLKGGDEAIGQDEIVVAKDKNGKLGIYDFDAAAEKYKIGGLIAPLDKTSINIKAQPTAKGKSSVIAQGNQNAPIANQSNSKKDEPRATPEEIKKFRAGGDKAPNVKVYLVPGVYGMSDQILDYDDLVEGKWTDADIKKLRSLNAEEVKRFRIAENKK